MAKLEELLHKNQLLKMEIDLIKNEFEQYKRESIKWSWEDIYYPAGEQGYECTKEQAQEILEDMIANHDAEYGINWNVVNSYIQDNCNEKEYETFLELIS